MTEPERIIGTVTWACEDGSFGGRFGNDWQAIGAGDISAENVRADLTVTISEMRREVLESFLQTPADHHTIEDDGWITLHSSPPIEGRRCEDCRRPQPGPHQSWCPMQDEGEDR